MSWALFQGKYTELVKKDPPCSCPHEAFILLGEKKCTYLM